MTNVSKVYFGFSRGTPGSGSIPRGYAGVHPCGRCTAGPGGGVQVGRERAVGDLVGEVVHLALGDSLSAADGSTVTAICTS
jgi:hypothetical protein